MHISGLKINFKQINFSFLKLYQILTTGTHRNYLPTVSSQCCKDLYSRTLKRRKANWFVYVLRRNCLVHNNTLLNES